MSDTPINSKPRTLVNILGIPGILTVIWLGGWWFFAFILVVAIIGAIELKNLATMQKGSPSLVLLIVSVSLVLIGYQVDYGSSEYVVLFTGITAFCLEIFRNQSKPLLNVSVMIFGTIWLGFLLGCMVYLRNFLNIGLELILLMFLSVWACDSAAFFFGKLFGKKKILPTVSPKKSWVGSVSGLMAAFLVTWLLHSTGLKIGEVLDFNRLTAYFKMQDIVTFGVIFGGFSQLGDFAESLLKREAGVKDTGNFLQGHGGILDRFDSLTVAAPLTYIYVKFIV